MAGVMEICLGRCSFCDAAGTRETPVAGDPSQPARICEACVGGFLDDPHVPLDGAREAFAGGGSRDAFARTRRPAGSTRPKRADLAIAEFQKIIDRNPQDIRSRLKLGDLLAKVGRTPEAAEQYRFVADSYSRDGFFLKAVAVYKQMLKLGSGGAGVRVALASLYVNLGLFSDALAQLEIAASEKTANTPEMIQTLRRLAELQPDHAAQGLLADFLVRAGEPDEAVAIYRRIANDLEHAGASRELIAILERILTLSSTDATLALRLALLYLDQGDPRRALAKLQVCFRANPRDIGTLAALERAFDALGQAEKAQSVREEVGRLRSLGGDAVDAGESDDAAIVDERPAGPIADDPATLQKLLAEARVYVDYELFEKAHDHLRGVVYRNPESTDALALLASVEQRLQPRPLLSPARGACSFCESPEGTLARARQSAICSGCLTRARAAFRRRLN